MSGKKVCINNNSSYYTGKEQSPLHFGLSAEGYEINAIMEGYDKELWIVEVRNNKKVWTKKDHINKMTYEKPLICETSEISTNNNENNNVDILNIHDNISNNTSINDHNIVVNSDDENNNKDKVSKTIKPTDYTLFITYRIHQMKETSNDNKKNYDCARYEWKEYKKKPNELKLIMIEANNFSKSNCKINKK
jgi:hypothetical protein